MPIDGSPPGSPVPGILQAITLEWIAIAFSNSWKWKVKVKSFRCVQLFESPWTADYQGPPPMGFSRQECWSGLLLSSPLLFLGKCNWYNSKFYSLSLGMSWSCGLLWEGETEYCQVTLISLLPTLVLMWFLNFPELMKEMIGWEEIWSKEIAFCLVLLCSDISVLCAWQIFKTNNFLNVFLGYIYTENIHRYSLLCRIYILSLNSFDLSYCSIVKWCSTICNPMDYSTPGFLSLSPGICSNLCPLSQWCYLTISSSVVPFSCLLSFPASKSFPMSQFFASGGQSIGVSASASVLPMNIQGWFPLGRTGWISLQSKGLSRVFSNTTVQKHQFFGAQLSL